MATDITVQIPDEGGDRPRERAEGEKTGFFHIYKKGHGYWTRMGSAAAAMLIGALCVRFLYTNLNVWLAPLFMPPNPTPEASAHALSMTRVATLSACGAFVLGFALVIYYLLNKPDYADFLIDTDREMKKVNWTSRKELFGSTKVVIFFMFLIAFLLFAFDIAFGYLFYFMGVLKSPPL